MMTNPKDALLAAIAQLSRTESMAVYNVLAASLENLQELAPDDATAQVELTAVRLVVNTVEAALDGFNTDSVLYCRD